MKLFALYTLLDLSGVYTGCVSPLGGTPNGTGKIFWLDCVLRVASLKLYFQEFLIQHRK